MNIKRYIKFNENNNSTFGCFFIIKDKDNDEIYDYEIFYNEEDMYNSLLNIINKHLSTKTEIYDESHWIGKIGRIHKNEDGKFIFIDVTNAISWYQTYCDVDVQIIVHAPISTNVKLGYGVEYVRKYGSDAAISKGEFNL